MDKTILVLTLLIATIFSQAGIVTTADFCSGLKREVTDLQPLATATVERGMSISNHLHDVLKYEASLKEAGFTHCAKAMKRYGQRIESIVPLMEKTNRTFEAVAQLHKDVCLGAPTKSLTIAIWDAFAVNFRFLDIIDNVDAISKGLDVEYKAVQDACP